MKKNILHILLLTSIFSVAIPVVINAQNQEGQEISIRTLPVEWYMYSGEGVKLQYRTFDNRHIILYLPSSMENKFYRFVESPKGSGSTQGLPVLIVHLKGKDVTFIDIYTRYQKEKGMIANFTSEDLKKFKEVEKEGKVKIQF